jgi:NAD(P)-dependent dehydrogenase (short-subunit alcohol dehydrogenase family)
MILSGKIALVTGATGGLGKEISLSLAKHGCYMVLLGRNRDKLLSLQGEIGEDNCEIRAIDLTSASEIKAMSEQVSADILINCAGVFPINNIENTTLEEFDNCLNVNLRAPFLLTKYLTPHMIQSGWGRVVNIASSSAYAGFKGTSTYCSSKHGLLGLSRSLYNELKEENVRVFCVSPGSIQTPMGETIKDQDYSTFMDPRDISDFITKIISYDSNMIPEETRLNRVIIR